MPKKSFFDEIDDMVDSIDTLEASGREPEAHKAAFLLLKRIRQAIDSPESYAEQAFQGIAIGSALGNSAKNTRMTWRSATGDDF